MSTVKISDLPSLAAVDLDDEFVLVDDSAGITKKATGVYQQGNILGTVSESGGTPTGAVIERGSNSNGEYVKYADGTMICYVQGVSLSETDSGTRLEGSWTFPAIFANDNAVIGMDFPTNSQVDSSGPFWNSTNRDFEDCSLWGPALVTTSIATLRLWAVRGQTFGTGQVIEIGCTAIGRWY